jgi:hypothetical protein
MRKQIQSERFRDKSKETSEARCVQCKKPVSEAEMQERYKELIDAGIAPMIVVMCKSCRGVK